MRRRSIRSRATCPTRSPVTGRGASPGLCETISGRSWFSLRIAREAEKFAQDVAARIPCPQPLRLTKDQENAAGPDLREAARPARGVSSQRPQLRAAGGLDRAAGQGRAVARRRGDAGPERGHQLFAPLRAGHRDQFHRGRISARGLPSDLLQMFGRAGRRGLDEQGYVLVSERSPRLGQARAGHLRRSAPLPWRPLLQELAGRARSRRLAPRSRGGFSPPNSFRSASSRRKKFASRCRAA